MKRLRRARWVSVGMSWFKRLLLLVVCLAVLQAWLTASNVLSWLQLASFCA